MKVQAHVVHVANLRKWTDLNEGKLPFMVPEYVTKDMIRVFTTDEALCEICHEPGHTGEDCPRFADEEEFNDAQMAAGNFEDTSVINPLGVDFADVELVLEEGNYLL